MCLICNKTPCEFDNWNVEQKIIGKLIWHIKIKRTHMDLTKNELVKELLRQEIHQLDAIIKEYRQSTTNYNLGIPSKGQYHCDICNEGKEGFYYNMPIFETEFKSKYLQICESHIGVNL